MKHLVIVAGGLGSRLAPLTNHIPKFLVNIGKQTGFVEQIRYWKQYYPQSITVIVHSAYKDLVQAYFDLYFKGDEQLMVHCPVKDGEDWHEDFKPTPLIVKTVDEANGSAPAIMTTCQHLVGKEVLFSWCDVLPAEPFDDEELVLGGAYAFTNYDHPNRYDLTQVGVGWAHRVPALREDGRGGIFGLYYVSRFEEKPYVDGQDFVELLSLYSHDGYVREVKLNSIIDFGDKPKLDRVRSTADASREFNKVEMQGNLVLKSALTEQGNGLIEREIKWYDLLEKSGDTSVTRPKHWAAYDRHSFVMSRVQGVAIWELWPTLDAEGRRMVLSRLLKQLEALHNSDHTPEAGTVQIQRDVQIEACDKLLSRYTEIEQVIKAFGDVHTVNGWILGKQLDPRETITRLHEHIANFYQYGAQYSLIHGDLQMSNSMINPDTLEITLIDPRGYFGKTESYGPPEYDYGKLLYSLSGYDLFNYSKTMHIKKLRDGVLEFDTPRPNLDGCKDLILRSFNQLHMAWLAVIWIGLAGYIKNDPVKSLCAHYHGLVLADLVLNQEPGALMDFALGF